MEIKLPERHTLQVKWFRNKSRYDTVTDCKFINENTIITANRECGKIYVLNFSLNPSFAKVIYTTDTVFHNQLKYIDLFIIHEGLIYFVSLDNTIGCLQLENNQLIKKDLITVPGKYYFHSITFHPTKKNIVYLGGALYNPKLVVYDIEQRKLLHEISLEKMENLLIKDVKFLDENTIVVSGTGGLISRSIKTQTYDSGIGVYDANTFSLIDFVDLKSSHTDGLGLDEDNTIYIVCQNDTAENISKFKFENNKLVQLKGLSVPQFPHGLDIKNGIMAVTSMKNSSICVFQL